MKMSSKSDRAPINIEQVNLTTVGKMLGGDINIDSHQRDNEENANNAPNVIELTALLQWLANQTDIGGNIVEDNSDQSEESKKNPSPIDNPALAEDSTAMYEWLSTIQAENFLLLLAISVFNFGERRFIIRVYNTFFDIFSKYISDENKVSDKEIDSGANEIRIPKRKQSAEEVFGTGFENRLRLIGASIEQINLHISGRKRRFSIVKLNNPKLHKALWDMWRRQWTHLLEDLYPVFMGISIYGDYIEQIIAAQALGEFTHTDLFWAEKNYLTRFAGFELDYKVRYNVGYILSIIATYDADISKHVFGLLDTWSAKPWRFRWTAAATCSRIFPSNVYASIEILDKVAKKSEERYKQAINNNALHDAYLETIPYRMIWHSVSSIFLTEQKEILELLGKWLDTPGRHKTALPDIARELFLDIMQSHFDIRTSEIIQPNPLFTPDSNQDESVNISNNEIVDREKSGDQIDPPTDEEIIPDDTEDIDFANKGEKNEPEEVIEETNEEEKTLEQQLNDGAIRISKDKSDLNIDSSTTRSRNTFSYENQMETELTKDELNNLLQIDEVYKNFWQILHEDYVNLPNNEQGNSLSIVTNLVVESLRNSQPTSKTNRYVPSQYRQAPYKAQLNIFRQWLLLTDEEGFKFINEPLKYLLLESYKKLGEIFPWAQTKRFKNHFVRWSNDSSDELFENSYLKNIIEEMDYIETTNENK